MPPHTPGGLVRVYAQPASLSAEPPKAAQLDWPSGMYTFRCTLKWTAAVIKAVS